MIIQGPNSLKINEKNQNLFILLILIVNYEY